MDINARGFRGPPLREPKEDLRVAVFGDSLVMAENVREEDSFVLRLATELEGRLDRAVEGVNAGVSGYGPDQACLRFEQEIDGLDADLVVLVLCATNDFGDLVRNKLFGLLEDGSLVRNEITFDERLIADFERRKSLARRPAIARAWSELRRSLAAREDDPARGHALNPFVPMYLQSARDEWVETVIEENRRVRTLFNDVYDADVAIQPESESARYKVALMRAVLGRWRQECERRDLPLLAVVVPSAVDLDPSFWIRVDRALYPGYDPARLATTLADLLEGASIPCVDLSHAFVEAGPSTLFEGFLDIHWNEAGQALAGRVVAAETVARSLLER